MNAVVAMAIYNYHVTADGNRHHGEETDSLGHETGIDWNVQCGRPADQRTRDASINGQNGNGYTDSYTLGNETGT